MSDHWKDCWRQENHPACRLLRIRELEREVARLSLPRNDFGYHGPPQEVIVTTWPPTASGPVPCFTQPIRVGPVDDGWGAWDPPTKEQMARVAAPTWATPQDEPPEAQ